MFLGLDSSTQSLTAVLIDPDSGKITCQLSVNFGADLPHYQSPSGFIPGGPDGEVHANPLMWLEALDLLFARLAVATDLSKVKCIAGSGQQHGSVYLDGTFDERVAGLVISNNLVAQLSPALTRKTAPIWMDTSTGAECAEITAALGGSAEVCRRSGSNAIERFSGPQIRRFYKSDPDAYQRTGRIHLVSSFLASVMAGKSVPIDFGDGAGMNLLNLAKLGWDTDLLAATAPDLAGKLLPPALATTIQGNVSPYFVGKYGIAESCRVALFTGDNPASLVGMGATTPGNVVISLGTSDTFFAAMPGPKTDPNGFGHVFGNPAGGFMSLICFRNGSLAREALRDKLGLDWSAFDRDALTTTLESAGQNLMLPFFGPEITPRHDFTGPVLKGSAEFESGTNAALQVRALLEGQFLNMRLHSQWMGVKTEKIRLTGGASKNDGIAQLVADIFQCPVERIDVSNSAALGAALIAAAADGHDLPALQDAFCVAAPGATLQPNPSLAVPYEKALVDFKALLDANR
ncbi:MAG: FGGY-family carbohydrate kinase [Luteolibacter sp.]|uniref:xylulokinase n=1 Tax=Luteolibacter sp. TaxID=1962973 RepID=UPI0032644584